MNGRYYDKTLKEVDGLSLVRDRSGWKSREGVDEEEEGNADGLLERDGAAEQSDKGKRNDRVEEKVEKEEEEQPYRPPKTKHQQLLEDEWGLSLHRSRSPPPSVASTISRFERVDESDTADDREDGYPVSDGLLFSAPSFAILISKWRLANVTKSPSPTDSHDSEPDQEESEDERRMRLLPVRDLKDPGHVVSGIMHES
jgi:hypothetical protein